MEYPTPVPCISFNEAGILHPEKRESKAPVAGGIKCFNEAGILHPEKQCVPCSISTGS